MGERVRCVEGRLFRHDPQHDDPYLETDVGQCPDCSGEGYGDDGEPVTAHATLARTDPLADRAASADVCRTSQERGEVSRCRDCSLYDLDATRSKSGAVLTNRAARCLWKSTETYPLSVRDADRRPIAGWMRPNDGDRCKRFIKRDPA
jgi:hypothetical protein